MKRKPKASPSPVLIFPAHGCEAIGALTQSQLDEKARANRQTLRKYHDHPGVKALVALLEEKAAWLMQGSLHPASGEFGRGEASGGFQMVATYRNVMLSEEDQEAQTQEG